MKRGSGKNKGSGFERDIAKKLSLWVSDGERTDIFWRSAGSGSKATVTGEETQSGDICAVHELGRPFVKKFFTEIKFYRNLNLPGLIFGQLKRSGTTSGVTDFWIKTREQAEKFNKLPLLIMKQNNLPILLGVSAETLYQFKAAWGNIVVGLARFPQYNLVVLDFDSLLKNCDGAISWK